MHSTGLHRQTITASLACLPSSLPSTQPSPPAPAGALAPSYSPPSAICWATHRPYCVREWALGHGSTQARVPGYQVSMCEPCVCREAAAQLGSSGRENQAGRMAMWHDRQGGWGRKPGKECWSGTHFCSCLSRPPT